MNRRQARTLAGRIRRSRRWLRAHAQTALATGNDRTALRMLLEFDDRFPPDPWVLQNLAEICSRLRLPDRGHEYVRRCQALEDAPDLTDVTNELDGHRERWHRRLARVAHVRNEPQAALGHAVHAVDVAEPTTWTLRVLTDAAIAAESPATARPHIDRAIAARPHDETLQALKTKLHD